MGEFWGWDMSGDPKEKERKVFLNEWHGEVVKKGGN